MPEPKWYRELTPYQWRVLVCACLGWALDIMDGFLYAIILFPAMSDLLGTTDSGLIGWYGGITLSIFMIGWALGGLIFGPIADRYGRTRTMPTTFFLVSEFAPALFISPIMGFFAGGVFTGFAIYFPELFPTALRATAQGFCYNFARFFSAAAPFLAGLLISTHGAFAPAITIIGSIYVLGLLILIFARETHGQALPD
jgi:MFS family permease